MLGDSAVAAVAVVVRTRPRAIPLAMITMRKSTHGFPFLSYMSMGLGGPSGRRSSAIIEMFSIQLSEAKGNKSELRFVIFARSKGA